MTAPKLYPLVDRPTRKERDALGVKVVLLSMVPRSDGVHAMAVQTHEFRPPRAGEWYLSGAIIEAYRANHDFTTSYHIARLVAIDRRTVVSEVIIVDSGVCRFCGHVKVNCHGIDLDEDIAAHDFTPGGIPR